MQSVLRTAFKFVIGLIVGSLGFELYLRCIEATSLWRVLPVAEASLYGPSREAGYTHRAGAGGVWITESRAKVAISALGLRDAPGRSEVKPAGALRFAVAGDSMVEALQVPLEQTFVALLQAELRRRGHTGAEVINLGLAGARPAVIVERLRLAAGRLRLDGAVVSVSAGDFLAGTEDDTSEFAGYVRRGPNERAVIAHAFRDSRGFALRTSAVGQGIYWAVDHVRLALVLNNRKNAGLAGDLVQPGVAPRAANVACGEADLRPHEGLWLERTKTFAHARLAAFLADLSAISREHSIPLVLSLRNIGVDCPPLADRRKRLIDQMASRVQTAGLMFDDHEMAMEPHLAGRSRSSLQGFGARLGNGHLNADGHRVYANAMTDAITEHLLPRR